MSMATTNNTEVILTDLKQILNGENYLPDWLLMEVQQDFADKSFDLASYYEKTEDNPLTTAHLESEFEFASGNLANLLNYLTRR